MVMPKMPTKNVLPIPTVKAVKKFQVKSWDCGHEGERVLIYADTGMGKTTLAALAPDPVFIGLDEGGRKIKNPRTGELLKYIPEIENFADIRVVLRQSDLFDGFKSVVIDTVTILEDMCLPHILATIPKENGARAMNIVAYGYNKGYQHLYDQMKLILQDCDTLIHRGLHVILIAQGINNRVANPGGEDYLRDGPRLYAGKPSVESLYCEWADHILRIGYQDVWVKEKKVGGDLTRVINTKPEMYYRAKSRTIKEPIISFATEQDDSVWKFIFGN